MQLKKYKQISVNEQLPVTVEEKKSKFLVIVAEDNGNRRYIARASICAIHSFDKT